MDIGKEDSDEDRVAALSAVVAVGEQVYVKVVEIKEDDGSGRYTSLNQQCHCVQEVTTAFWKLLCAYASCLWSGGHQLCSAD